MRSSVCRCPFALFLALTVGFMALLHRTRFGRYVYLIGQNPRAAAYAGTPVFRTLVVAYALTSLMAALSGLILASYFGSARSDFGTTALMPAITAVVLGGTSIYGGSGTILGTALAALLVGLSARPVLQLVGVSSHVSSALSGGPVGHRGCLAQPLGNGTRLVPASVACLRNVAAAE